MKKYFHSISHIFFTFVTPTYHIVILFLPLFLAQQRKAEEPSVLVTQLNWVHWCQKLGEEVT